MQEEFMTSSGVGLVVGVSPMVLFSCRIRPSDRTLRISEPTSARRCANVPTSYFTELKAELVSCKMRYQWTLIIYLLPGRPWPAH